MSKLALVTGAGSGVGQAVAVELVRRGWTVGLIGRRAEALQATRDLLDDPHRGVAYPCDVADDAAVRMAVALFIQRFGGINVLVNAAGTNVSPRALGEVSAKDFANVLDVNLRGAFHCAAAVVPTMRQQYARGDSGGTIVNIVSDAGLTANAKAGPAYVASKFGLTGLTQSINAEERANGIRACAIFPGDVNTPLLDKRPAPPPHEARLLMLQPGDITACVMLAIELPKNAVIEQLVIWPR